MVLTTSTMLPLGTRAPDFKLPDVVSGKQVQLADFAKKKALLVMFICRHCPYVQHLRQGLASFSRDYQSKDLAIVGISANDPETHPEDAPDKLAQEVREQDYRFPLLFDASQSVARAYTAACTPDFFLFDAQRGLVYRGQFDASRPGNGIAVTGSDLRAAVDAVLADRPVAREQKASLGCNIKWRAGSEPEYFKAR
jgi:peroxiredoxin